MCTPGHFMPYSGQVAHQPLPVSLSGWDCSGCTRSLMMALLQPEPCLMTPQDRSKHAEQLLAVIQSLSPMQDDGHGHQEIVPSLLTQDTLNPSFYGMRIIATELEALIDTLMTKVLSCPGHWTMHVNFFPKGMPPR